MTKRKVRRLVAPILANWPFWQTNPGSERHVQAELASVLLNAGMAREQIALEVCQLMLEDVLQKVRTLRPQGE